jgi:CO dehydrogenase maturation factor
MTTTIAVAGKGGVGKTTLSALLISRLADRAAVLAIDADPSSNLHLALGLDLEWTVGDIREDMLSQVKASLTVGGAAMGGLPGGLSKREHIDYEVRASVAEGARYDLIAMGRGEGPGCYCAVNHSLREVIDSISRNYGFVVIDNEAGMEHLSRRTTRDVQHLLVVTDASKGGITAAERILALRNELDIGVEHAYIVVNRLAGELPAAFGERIGQSGVELAATIPVEPAIAELELAGRPLGELDLASPASLAVEGLLGKIL